MNKIAVGCILILTVACTAQKTDKTLQGNDRLQLLAQDGYFYTPKQQTLIIDNQNELDLFYSKVNKTRKPGLPIPIVDFDKETILIACMGKQKDVNFPVLKVLEEDLNTISIGLNLSPKKNKSPIISYPFCVYKMSNTKKEILFKML